MSLAKKIQLRDGEEITDIIRQAGLAYFWQYFSGLAVLIIVSFFAFWLIAQGWLGYAIFGLGLLLGLYIIIHTRQRQRSNYWVITTERLVDIDRQGWFNETISSAFFDDIKDIFHSKKGIGARFFDYGAVVIETESDKYMLTAQNVARPQELANILIEARRQILE
ncbi:MAG: hypothetical protein PHD72_00310 [Patescibacteria group bacterium]|nr:hypothetical protein [Patescibacteria group bacterium]